MGVIARGRRVRRTEGEWRDLVARFRKSGLSARAFSRQERLSVVSLQRWLARLDGKATRKDFIAVVPAGPELPASRSWALEVILPDGIRLRFQG